MRLTTFSLSDNAPSELIELANSNCKSKRHANEAQLEVTKHTYLIQRTTRTVVVSQMSLSNVKRTKIARSKTC